MFVSTLSGYRKDAENWKRSLEHMITVSETSSHPSLDEESLDEENSR